MTSGKTVGCVLVAILVLTSFSVKLTEYGIKISGKEQLHIHGKQAQNATNMEVFKTKVNLSIPKIQCEGKYCRILYDDGERYLLRPGEPMLPMINVVATLPLGSTIIDVNCSFSPAEQKSVPGKILPAPLPVPTNVLKNSCSSLLSHQAFDDASYSDLGHSTYYPSSWSTYHTGGGIREGEHVSLLSVHVYPVRYAPHIDCIKYINEATIEVVYQQPAREISSSEDGHDLLVISPDEFTEALQPFVHHKNICNISTRLVTLQAIDTKGRDKPEQIKYYIMEAIEKWGIKYVLLVGNRTKMPVRYVHPNLGNVTTPFITDLYYADVFDAAGKFASWDSNNNSVFGELNETTMIDQMDLYPDVYIGRLLACNVTEVNIAVNKIIDYEKYTPGKAWFNNLTVCGGNTHQMWKDLFFKIIFGGGTAREGEYIGDRIIENMSGFNPKKLYASARFPFGDSDAEPLTVDNINRAINDGAGFVVFNGHGSPQAWATHFPLIKRAMAPFPLGYGWHHQLEQLVNKDKLPVIVLDACSCGDYGNNTGIQSPLAWDLISLREGGAVATYACTSLSWGYPGELCTKTLNGYVSTHLFKTYSEGNRYTGALLGETLTEYLNDQDALSRYCPLTMSYLCVEYWALFGDPSLRIGGYSS